MYFFLQRFPKSMSQPRPRKCVEFVPMETPITQPAPNTTGLLHFLPNTPGKELLEKEVTERGTINWRHWLACGPSADLGLLFLLLRDDPENYTGKIHGAVCLTTTDTREALKKNNLCF